MIRLLMLLATAVLTLAPAAELVAQQTAPAALIAEARAVTREVAGIRRLRIQQPVDFRVTDREAIRRFARSTLDREMTTEQWAAYGLLLRHVGMLPDSIDLRDLVVRLYTEQVAGYYDPHAKTFFLADWLPPLLQRGVVAHEVTHALQDQHFDLAGWLGEVDPNDDAALARSAVAEGDAMAAMLAYLLVPTGMALESIPDLETLLAGREAGIGPAYPTFDEAPIALQRLLLFPYVEGSGFVLSTYREHGWRGVDQLYRDPPTSTEQILHPDRYWEERDDPRRVRAPGGRPGDSLLTEGSWGEFGTSLVLESTLGDSAGAIAAGWDGDRYALFRGIDGDVRYAWTVVWDSAAAAERFSRTYAASILERFPGTARVTTGDRRIAIEAGSRHVDLTWTEDRVEVRETDG